MSDLGDDLEDLDETTAESSDDDLDLEDELSADAANSEDLSDLGDDLDLGDELNSDIAAEPIGEELSGSLDELEIEDDTDKPKINDQASVSEVDMAQSDEKAEDIHQENLDGPNIPINDEINAADIDIAIDPNEPTPNLGEMNPTIDRDLDAPALSTAISPIDADSTDAELATTIPYGMPLKDQAPSEKSRDNAAMINAGLVKLSLATSPEKVADLAQQTLGQVIPYGIILAMNGKELEVRKAWRQGASATPQLDEATLKKISKSLAKVNNAQWQALSLKKDSFSEWPKNIKATIIKSDSGENLAFVGGFDSDDSPGLLASASHFLSSLKGKL